MHKVNTVESLSRHLDAGIVLRAVNRGAVNRKVFWDHKNRVAMITGGWLPGEDPRDDYYSMDCPQLRLSRPYDLALFLHGKDVYYCFDDQEG